MSDMSVDGSLQKNGKNNNSTRTHPAYQQIACPSFVDMWDVCVLICCCTDPNANKREHPKHRHQ